MDIKRFIKQCRRVLSVSTKPDEEEYAQSIKITGLGIVIIGAVGFAVFLIFTLLLP